MLDDKLAELLQVTDGPKCMNTDDSMEAMLVFEPKNWW